MNKRKQVLKLISVAALSLAVVAPAAAGHRTGRDYYDYARVVRVKPIYETVQVESARTVCWKEPRHYHHGVSYTPEIFGAIVGGVVGNQFGSGSGRDIATVAGAVLGGSVAHDIKVRNGYGRGHSHHEMVERCRTEPVYHSEERVVGYRVKYRYRGKVYWTRTAEHPGHRIKVRVDVSPVF